MSDTREVKPDPSMIGGVSKAPFVFLPDPAAVFARRAARLRTLSASSELKPYLEFLAAIADAQAKVLAASLEPTPPPPDVLERAREFAMPPFDRASVSPEPELRETCRRLFSALSSAPKPEAAERALKRVDTADDHALDQLIRGALTDAIPAESVAEHLYVAAALQLHFTRLASKLDAQALKPVGTGACPACGGPPAVSLIAGWYGAESARYAACSLCSTLWNEVRVKCLVCGSTKGVGYEEIEGGAGTIKAETCDECGGYVKLLYQDKDTSLDPFADDVASLGLDQLLRGSAWRRAGANPFLAGY
jgi:FdhE protein